MDENSQIQIQFRKMHNFFFFFKKALNIYVKRQTCMIYTFVLFLFMKENEIMPAILYISVNTYV